MMDSNKWDEENIAKLLGEMPDIKDSRSKEDVLRRLKQDGQLITPMNNKSKLKKTMKWIPVLVSVAALLILSLLLPSMLNGGKGQMERATDTISVATDKNHEMSGSENENISEDSKAVEAQEEREMKRTLSDIDDGGSHFAVYPEDVGDDTVFHLGLVGDAAASVPVTFIIPNSQIVEDFGELQPTSFDLYEMYAAKIDEEALGFDDYHPYKGELTVEGNKLIQTLPVGHSYDLASASIEVHRSTLQDTFYGFDEIRFNNEDGTPVEFDQVGEPSKPMQLLSGINFYNYYISKHPDGQEYLSSNFSKSHKNFEQSLNEMKNKTNDTFSPVIPMNIDFEVIEEKGLTKVKFKEQLDLHSMNPKEATQMIDAILLTGASFELQLEFENVLQSQWNGFNFKEPLPIPVGSNQLPFLLK